VAPRLGGIKQKKLIIHPSASLIFLLFYSPKPRSHVRILIYRKWSICVAKVSEGMDWTLRAESRIEEKDIISTHIIFSKRRGIGEASQGIGEASQGCEIGVLPTGRGSGSPDKGSDSKFGGCLPLFFGHLNFNRNKI